MNSFSRVSRFSKTDTKIAHGSVEALESVTRFVEILRKRFNLRLIYLCLPAGPVEDASGGYDLNMRTSLDKNTNNM